MSLLDLLSWARTFSMARIQIDAAESSRVVQTMLMLLVFCYVVVVNATNLSSDTDWADAHATFYGGTDASGTMGGACGYENLYAQGYGTATAALSNELFNNGLICGACFQIVYKLDETSWCYSGQSITITATNNCPQGSFGGWCDYPKARFDLSYPMFQTLAQPIGGVIPVQYKRVSCIKQGGVRFTVNGNPYFNDVLVHNVASGGDVAALAMKGANTDWFNLQHGWGQYWSGGPVVSGQTLSFRATLGNGYTLEFWNVSPADWQFGQTFEATYNFS